MQKSGQANRRQQNEGRLDHPARANDLVHFDAQFGRRFSVFVDTEEEFDWTRPRSRDAINTSAVRHLPEFQRLMDAHGVHPCYLIDYPVADNARSRDVLAGLHADHACEIGTQLHPWVNPPNDEELNSFNSFVGNLPENLEREKLSLLTERIASITNGIRPTVYRAGRYGVGANTAKLLEEEGYRIDTSVRPHFDYSNEGGPSFLKYDSRPYWAGPTGQLLELPLGATYTGQLRRYGRWLIGDGRRNENRMASLARFGLAARVALTPEDMPIEDVKQAIQWMLRDGIQFFSFSFHSPSLAPGHTPYVRNSADLSQFYNWWDKILAFLAVKNIVPVAVTDVVAAAWRARSEQN